MRHVVDPSQKGTTSVGFAALITWFAAVLAGLYMLTVWLIENDGTSRHAAPSQLREPVIFGHLALAITGLGVWVAYLVLNRDILAWASVATLTAVVLLGITMFARWLPVYREHARPTAPAALTGPGWPAGTALPAGETSAVEQMFAVPAESQLPVVVIVVHGLLAGTTLVLVVLTTLGVGGS